MTINILGQDYDYQELPAKEDTALADSNGYCDGFAKTIRIDNDYNENHPTAIKDFDSFRKKVKRHEITHAFFHESGLDKYEHDELIVEWIALQFPKLQKAFEQVGAI